VDGSRTIRVIKRDGSREPFDVPKLAGAMFRAMRQTTGRYYDAWQLALAIELYVDRCGWSCVSSAAVLEMTVKVLHRSALHAAGDLLEAHGFHRRTERRRLRVCHGQGKVTGWDKSWLGELAERSWFLSRTTARILAGKVEEDLLADGRSVVGRQEVLDRLNERVVACGLADALPVRLPAIR